MNFVSTATVIKAHDRILAEFGGLAGIRDSTVLESATARPQHKHNYGETNVPRLAASLAFGLIQGHSFLDGNKRTGYATSEIFLNDNGYVLNANTNDTHDTIVGVAAGRVSEQQLSDWFEQHSRTQTVPAQGYSISMSMIRQQCLNYQRSNILELLSQRGGMTQ